MKNLKFDNATIIEKDGELFISEAIENNIVETKLVDAFRPYLNIEGFNIKGTKARVKGAGRKPATKYTCNCGKKLTSSDEDLVIQCLSCGNEFIKPE